MAPNLITLLDGRQLSYDLSGPTEGPIVLLSNSLLANYTTWDHFVKDLHAQGFRALRYDQPGHGASSAPSDLNATTFLTLTADVSALLQALKISKVYTWIGISMGAATGAIFVAQNPGVVQKLILSDTITCSPGNAGIDDPFAPRVQLAETKPKAVEELTEGTLARWFSEEWRAAHPDETDRMRQLMRTTKREGFITCCHALRHESFDLRPYLKKIGPAVEETLLIVGEQDANLPTTMAQMRDEIQSASKSPVGWVIIKKAGHVPVIDNRDQFTEAVFKFLKGGSDSPRSKA
ncbi:hypothetical protein DTO212C5_3502 [Paecilomyces variotii]|nr:hypothetical protein DTO212C5_3502 [Paecilomyces variotii]